MERNEYKDSYMKKYHLTIGVLLLFLSSISVKAQEKLWAIGQAVPGGKMELTRNASGSFKFAGTLCAGKLRIATTEEINNDTRFVKPDYEDSYIVNNGLPYTLSRDSTSAEWIVPFNEDLFQIEVLPSTSETGVVKGNLHKPWHYAYIAGGATDNGWSQFGMQRMTQDPSNPCVFTWTGTLKDNYALGYVESKRIKIQGQLAWESKSFHPYQMDEDLLESKQMRYSGDDTKWAVATDGTYHIEINTLYETIHAELVSNNSKETSTTAIKETKTNNFSLSTSPGNVLVATTSPTNISLCSEIGVVISKASGSQAKFSGLRNGLYILRCGDQAKKVIIK